MHFKVSWPAAASKTAPWSSTSASAQMEMLRRFAARQVPGGTEPEA
jgi:hypothetical protein